LASFLTADAGIAASSTATTAAARLPSAEDTPRMLASFLTFWVSVASQVAAGTVLCLT
jgi:hypothetical protein